MAQAWRRNTPQVSKSIVTPISTIPQSSAIRTTHVQTIVHPMRDPFIKPYAAAPHALGTKDIQATLPPFKSLPASRVFKYLLLSLIIIVAISSFAAALMLYNNYTKASAANA